MSPDPEGEVPPGEWRAYLEDFHDRQAGITERILTSARAGAMTPYDWIVAVTPAGRVLDVACGSGPLAEGIGVGWVGTDTSRSELEGAARLGRGPLVRADATATPLVAGSVDAVVCSMALMVLQPLDEVLVEMARVLSPRGVLVATMPATRAAGRDAARYARLVLALRRRLRYPNDGAMTHLGPALARAGLVMVSDETRCFGLAVEDATVAHAFIDSLYLPALDPRRRRQAQRVAERWIGSQIGVPVRRITAARQLPQRR